MAGGTGLMRNEFQQKVFLGVAFFKMKVWFRLSTLNNDSLNWIQKHRCPI